MIHVKANTVVQLLQDIVKDHGNIDIQWWKDDNGQYRPTTYTELYEQVLTCAAALRDLGVQRDDHVGLISDNRKEWLISDLGTLALGASDVPRGRDAMPHEIEYILHFSECAVCFAENEQQLQKILELKESLPLLEQIIVLDSEYDQKATENANVKIQSFLQFMETGKKLLNKKLRELLEKEIAKGTKKEIATLIFTSGTTGEPKGVMLTNENFLFQIEQVQKVVDVQPGDRWLSVLPVWHSFERILQYVAIGTASTIAYSKPIGKILLQDFKKANPTWMGSVPRIWESVMQGVYKNVKKKGIVSRGLFAFFVWAGNAHAVATNMVANRMPQFSKRLYPLDLILGLIPYLLLYPFVALGNVLVFKTIKAKLGTNFKAGVSGGGSLPKSVDRFFKAIGITLLDGYGLTETAPVIGIRSFFHQVPSTVSPLPETEISIRDEKGNEVPPGVKGVIHARGPQVMKGYYKRPELTDAIIGPDGFLNTGDLGMWTHKGEYAICGRAKDTIVLSGGENIEPVPIEAKLRESEYIEQAVVLGQDQKYLAALIVPDTKAIELYLKDNSIPYISRGDLISMPEIIELINEQVGSLVSTKNGFKSFEHIVRFSLIPVSFEIGKELSAKQEVKRHVISEIYAKEIKKLFS